MLVAKDGGGRRCIARRAEKADSPYYCPSCNEEVVLKKGAIKIHHFSHRKDSECQYGKGESQEHLQAKEGLYETLSQHPECKDCQLERVLPGVRPDVSVYIRNQPVAIEVQKSAIEICDVKRRFASYRELGFSLVWVIPISSLKTHKKDFCPEYVTSLQPWQNFLHECYFDRLYFWEEGAIVKPVHFADYKVYVEPNDWGGGYHKTLKNRKAVTYTPRKIQRLNLVDDFESRFARQFTYKRLNIPDRQLWSDIHKGWW